MGHEGVDDNLRPVLGALAGRLLVAAVVVVQLVDHPVPGLGHVLPVLVAVEDD